MSQAVFPSTRPLSRRSMLTGGTAASAGLWAAPSILSLDRASAAVGSCGAPPRQVDFSRFSGSLPSTFLSDDGTVSINFSMSDPSGVQVPGFQGVVSGLTVNGLDNPLVTAMEKATNGDYVDLVFDFSVPVSPTFFLVDIDALNKKWEDTVTVTGVSGGSVVNPASMITGGAQTFLGPATVRGDYSTSGSDGNVQVVFDQPINQLTIRHQDNTKRKKFQWIGVHDFYWC